MSREIWRPIKEFPGYGISDHGRVRRSKNRRLVRPAVNQTGYVYVGLVRDGAQHQRGLARLVAKAFLPAPPPYFDTPINMNGDRWDCSMGNLVWRPRWFAVRYHRQFYTNYKEWWHATPGPIQCVETEEVFSNSFDAACFYGVLEIDLMSSLWTGTDVWPQRMHFIITY